MGINDRDYLRDDEPQSFHNESFRSSHGVSSNHTLIKTLIAINVAVFVLHGLLGPIEALHGAKLNDWLGLSLPGLKRYELWRAVTYGFCHLNVGHILFNMFGLWTFGRLTESVRGTRETAAFYLMAIIVSGLAHFFFSGASRSVLIGASGGVSAITILSAFYYGRLKMQFLFIPIPIELRWVALIYVGLDAWGAASGTQPIAYWAHLGGAAFAAAYHLLGLRLIPTGAIRFPAANSKQPAASPWNERPAAPASPNAVSKPKVRIYEPPVDGLEAELDRVLEKINREGKGSLTAAENETLQRASEVYRSRR